MTFLVDHPTMIRQGSRDLGGRASTPESRSECGDNGLEVYLRREWESAAGQADPLAQRMNQWR